MYEVEVELDDGDWMLQGFFNDRNDALAWTIQQTSGRNPRRCRVVALKWNDVTGSMQRSTVLEASNSQQVPRPGPRQSPPPPKPGDPAQVSVQGGRPVNRPPKPAPQPPPAPKPPPQSAGPGPRPSARPGARPGARPREPEDDGPGTLMTWLLRLLTGLGILAAGMGVVYVFTLIL